MKVLKKKARKIKKKAAGPDDWMAKYILLLPEAFWTALAQLWNKMIATGDIPDVLARIRVVGIPRETGGLRPLCIASAIWRIGASAVMDLIAPWATEWAPPEVTGGFRARGVAHVHGRVRAARFESLRDKKPFAICLQDLAKAFDRISVEQALTVLRELGMPDCLCTLVLNFYRRCERIFMLRGETCEIWKQVRHGIIQGCPFSMLLIGAIMTCWSQTSDCCSRGLC